MANTLSNLTPRQQFQRDGKQLSAHRDFLASAEFERGINAALLELQSELALGCKDQYSAMAMGLRLLGAKELVQKLWDLGIVPSHPARVESVNLDHRV